MSKITSECPKDGACEVEILKNKQLLLLHDDLGGMYYDIKDHDGTTVIHFQYNKTTEANLQDGHYREDILFEVKNSDKSLNLTDSELQQTNLIFGRHCFCKGQTGYFKIKKGRLNLFSKKMKSILIYPLKMKKFRNLFVLFQYKKKKAHHSKIENGLLFIRLLKIYSTINRFVS
ncbi:hypothetical protein H9X57_11980 [Flavobacterium piscinae]|uniref:hypothetical protein n=1 Tax=Flavobacterium piscinae TaxID=2506424 RepID=UPI00198FCC94|nr:hypothetical protein [Flavobacterium piscinae]MBC8883807.1 hypothetical protein [Flavobacterium piscinae]